MHFFTRFVFRTAVPLLLLAGSAINSSGQDTIYYEGFSYPDSTKIGPGSPPKWTLDISKTSFSFWGRFQVTGGQFEGFYTNGEAVWLSKWIPINGYDDVKIFADFSETGTLENTDYIRAFYSLNGATPVVWANYPDDFTAISPSAGPFTGDSLRIIIRVNNNDFAIEEHHFFDNVLVIGEMPSAPIGSFVASTQLSCDGFVQFTDQSLKKPTSWKWDFGDGSTDTVQHPVHSYSASGTYTITLVAANALGTDTVVKTSYITVTLGKGPSAPQCRPHTFSHCCGFGITGFSFHTINNSSADASEGYQDYTCGQEAQVTAGNTYPVSVKTDQPSEHNVRVWIDYNNDGKFDGAGEMVFSADNSLNASGQVTIPATAVLNTSLRLRVAADYAYNPVPSHCDSIEYGQAEDYSVVVKENTSPPQAGFKADSLSCSATVKFTDLSQNVPTSWYWDFGDGTTSLVKNPSHTFSKDSTYTVKLIASNAYGSDTAVKQVIVDTDRGPVAASCSPATLGYCCGYGIYNFTFHTINQNSPDAAEGYRDFSCLMQAAVEEGKSYPVSIKTGTGNPQDTKVWIDYNNDGVLDNTTELVFSSMNSYDPSGNITVAPAVFDKPLRMRVSSDYTGSGFTSCSNLTYGQAEDYTVIIKQAVVTGNANPSNAGEGMDVFPNPAVSEIHLRTKSANGILISLENIYGQLVYREETGEKGWIMKTLDISGLPTGVYFLSVSDGEKKSTQRIIIHR